MPALWRPRGAQFPRGLVDDHYVLDGTKTWISNGGIADYYCVFAKTDVAAGTRGITAFIVDADTPGLDSSEHIASDGAASAGHAAVQRLQGTRERATGRAQWRLQAGDADAGHLPGLGGGRGAGHGTARSAEAVAHAKQRQMFGQTLADFQLTQAKLGEMAALVDAAALLTYRAAWLRDEGEKRSGVGVTAEAAEQRNRSVAAAMAKMTATENAQRVIDMALQMHGGLGVKVGTRVESLYRDIRSLRIYEGATEVQQLIIGKSVLQGVT
jgi:acyl-CoA dehydrogenase